MLMGNVGKDPVITETKSGMRRASFSLATYEYRKDKTTNEKHQITQWHTIVTFTENIINHIEKNVFCGCRVFVEGCLQYRESTSKDGNKTKIKITEVVISPYKGQIQVIKNSTAAKTTNDEHDLWD